MTQPIRLPVAGLVLAIGLGGAALATGSAHAASPSSFAESRGYQNCVEAAGREVRLIRTDADYFIYDHADSRRYYLNGHALRSGAGEAIRIACSTTRSGSRVIDVQVDAGSYAGRLVDPVDIARN